MYVYTHIYIHTWLQQTKTAASGASVRPMDLLPVASGVSDTVCKVGTCAEEVWAVSPQHQTCSRLRSRCHRSGLHAVFRYRAIQACLPSLTWMPHRYHLGPAVRVAPDEGRVVGDGRGRCCVVDAHGEHPHAHLAEERDGCTCQARDVALQGTTTGGGIRIRRRSPDSGERRDLTGDTILPLAEEV